MSKELNFKPYLIIVGIICAILCIFSYKMALGLVLGTVYFFVSDFLNRSKFPKLNNKALAISKVFMIIFIQFCLIILVAFLSFYIGGLSSFFVSFVGICIPHIYFIIVELMKGRK